MIIFGTSGITSVQSRGTYHCPACGPGAGYQHKSVNRFFTLFFVPLIPMGKVADFVQCERCGGTFKPEVLTWGGNVPSSPDGGPPPLPGAMPSAFPQPLPSGHSGPGFHDSSATIVTYRSNGLAKASMILGIVGLVTSFLICPSIFLCITGLVMGIVGLSRAKKGLGLVGGKNQAVAGIACSSVGLVAMFVIGFLVAKDGKPDSGSRSPRQAAAMSISSSSGQTGYGNNPKAVKLAEKYATLMSGMHQVAFESSKGNAPKSSKYVVHCELRDGTCAFLACVPQYRKFTDEAKTSLEELAWSTARAVLKDEPSLNAETTDLCVGLKGMVLFGSVMTGSLKASSPTTHTKDEEDMDPFFPVFAEREAETVGKE
jgi:hypothetical protein